MESCSVRLPYSADEWEFYYRLLVCVPVSHAETKRMEKPQAHTATICKTSDTVEATFIS